MSDLARLWSRSLKGGLNFAEHGVCRELAEHHNAETNLCFPSLDTLCDIYECSRVYVGQVLTRLENWRFITRVEWFDAPAHFGKQGRQTSNRYKLNLYQHFPDPFPEGRQTNNKNPKAKTRPYDKRDFAALSGAAQGKKYLRMIHNLLSKDPTLAAGIKEGFLQRFPSAEGKPPAPAHLWLSIESETHETQLLTWMPEIQTALSRETMAGHLKPLPVEIKLLALWYRGRRRRKVEPFPTR